MAAACSLSFIAVIIQLCGHYVAGLYEDQVGKYDWRQQYIGAIKFAEFDLSSGSGRRVVVTTEQNVVASLTSKNGAISWRQIMENGDRGRIDAMIHYKNNVITLSPVGQYLRSWHSTTGHLTWETSFPPTPATHGGSALYLGSEKNKFAALASNYLGVFDSLKGGELWKKHLTTSESTTYKFLGASTSGIVVAGPTTGGVVINKYSSDGVQSYTKTIPAFWVKDNTKCIILDIKYMVCYDDSTDSLQWISLKDPMEFKATSLHSLNLAFTTPEFMAFPEATGSYFGLKLAADKQAVFKLNGNLGIQLVKDFTYAYVVHATRYEEEDVFSVISSTDSKNFEIQLHNVETGQPMTEFKISTSLVNYHGLPVKLVSLLAKKKDGTTAHRALVVMEDHSVFMVGQAGKINWIREEALASILAVEMVDLPVSENQAKFEDEFGSNGRDIAGMFVKRFETQLSQLKTFLLHVKSRLLMNARHHQHHVTEEDEGVDDDGDQDDDYMTRDEFNLHKMIVAVTASGKVFGLDSFRGRIVWQHYLKELVPYSKQGRSHLMLYVQRSTAHFPHAPQCAVLGKNKVTGNGLLYTFNPITGVPVGDSRGHDLGHTVSVASLLSLTDQHFLKGLIMLDGQRKVHLFPESMVPHIVEERNSVFMFTVDTDTGLVQGYGLKYAQGLKSEELWSVNLPSDVERITGIASKRSIEHVHSQGKVLADRSVLYKYVNPNLIAIFTESLATDDKSFISVYLLDTVSGHMLFQANHKRARGPVNMVHSENWIVYNYWNIKARRNEVSVMELYEGANQHNATAFSSLDPPPLPIVMRQSYIMPTSISALASSITEKGLANKNVIFALKNGHLLQVPKMWLDPRRPITPTSQHREEGVPPYIPELPYDTLAMANYNQTVYNVRGIQTAPAGLESTSLVLAYGLDLFYTKVTPSNMFDVLKEDFDYFFISSVLTAMVVVTIGAQRLAARKALKKAWK